MKKMDFNWKLVTGFTLIELLVVISIIGILVALSIFGLQGARKSSRDARRKADIELIRSGLEIYKADCDGYPVANQGYVDSVLANSGTELVGDDTSSPSCKSSNVYISQMPQDPRSPAAEYVYWSDGNTYKLCASLEQTTGSVTCETSSTCGSSSTCNYVVGNP